MNELNGYKLSRAWFDWGFENPEKIKPIHHLFPFLFNTYMGTGNYQ